MNTQFAVGVGLNQARIDSKALAAHQTLSHAAHDGLKIGRRMLLWRNQPWRLREKVE